MSNENEDWDSPLGLPSLLKPAVVPPRGLDGWRNLRWHDGIQTAPVIGVETVPEVIQHVNDLRASLRCANEARQVAQREVADLKERLAASGVETRRELMAQGWTAPAQAAAAAALLAEKGQQIEALRKALSFYADRSRYQGPNVLIDEPDAWSDEAGVKAYRLDVTRDGGRIAALALASTRPENT